MGHGSTCPTFTNGRARGTVSRIANKKVTKLYWPSGKRSPKRLIVILGPKSGGARPRKIFFQVLQAGPVPPTSKFVPAPLDISNIFGKGGVREIHFKLIFRQPWCVAIVTISDLLLRQVGSLVVERRTGDREVAGSTLVHCTVECGP